MILVNRTYTLRSEYAFKSRIFSITNFMCEISHSKPVQKPKILTLHMYEPQAMNTPAELLETYKELV